MPFQITLSFFFFRDFIRDIFRDFFSDIFRDFFRHFSSYTAGSRHQSTRRIASVAQSNSSRFYHFSLILQHISFERDDLIERCFHLGVQQREILAFLILQHGIPMSLRQLKRILSLRQACGDSKRFSLGFSLRSKTSYRVPWAELCLTRSERKKVLRGYFVSLPTCLPSFSEIQTVK